MVEERGARFRGANVVIQGLSLNSVAVAEALAEHSASISILVDRGLKQDEWDARMRISMAPSEAEVEGLQDLGVSVDMHDGPLQLPADCDVLIVDIFSGTRPQSPIVGELKERGGTVSSLADVVYALAPASTIGVTGTAGKSTATSVLEGMLSRGGVPFYMPSGFALEQKVPTYETVRQLGDMQPGEWLACELWSMHLEYMKPSPDIAVVTNLHPDHSDFHGSSLDYFSAKANILRYQRDDQMAILNRDDRMTQEYLRPLVSSRLAEFSLNEEVEQGVFLRDGRLVARWDGKSDEILRVEEIALPGAHLESVLAAATAALAVGVDPSAIRDALRDYKGLEGRLEEVIVHNGVRVVNNSLALTPAKATAGLRNFADGSVILICGGDLVQKFRDGGQHDLFATPEDRELLDETCEVASAKARQIVAVGDAGQMLKRDYFSKTVPDDAVHTAADVREAVDVALQLANSGDVVLFNPIFRMSTPDLESFNGVVRESIQVAD